MEELKNITCIGCLEDQPNQMAHMDVGGCLYINESQDNINYDEIMYLSYENGETNADSDDIVNDCVY